MQPYVLDLLAQVGGSSKDVIGVLFQELRRQGPPGHDIKPPRVGFQGPHGGDEDGGVGLEARVAALDVEEALRSHVRTEACLGNEKVSALDTDPVRQDRKSVV